MSNSGASQVALVIKNLLANAGDIRDVGSIPGLGRSWRREWQPSPVFLPGEYHGQRSLVGYSPWGHKELDTTEQLNNKQVALVVKNPSVNAGDIRDVVLIPGLGRFPGGGHGKPLQYSFLENTMDRGAWWAMVRRVAKSRTRLKRLSMHARCLMQSGFLFLSSFLAVLGLCYSMQEHACL